MESIVDNCVVIRLPVAPDPERIAARAVDLAGATAHPLVVAFLLNVRVGFVARAQILGHSDAVAIGDHEIRIADDLTCTRRIGAEMLGLVLVKRWRIATHAPHVFAGLFADELLALVPEELAATA